MSSRDASEGAGDRAPVSGIALLTLLALLFLGMVVLGIATGDVPIDNKALAFAPVFYSLTVMGGLVASFFGFTVLEAVLSRRGDPARGRERAALVILGWSPGSSSSRVCSRYLWSHSGSPRTDLGWASPCSGEYVVALACTGFCCGWHSPLQSSPEHGPQSPSRVQSSDAGLAKGDGRARCEIAYERQGLKTLDEPSGSAR